MVIEFSVVVAIIVGLVEIAKKFNLPKRYAPPLSVILGVGLSVFSSYASPDIVEMIILGVLAGLSASGLYDLGKEPIKKIIKYARL